MSGCGRDFTTAESTLSDAAGDARYRIENWDDDSVVRSLWAGGALPLSAMTMFGQLGLQPTELTDLPPDLADMSTQELTDYALENPDLAPALLPVLPTEAKQAIGEELADRGKDITESSDDISTEELEEYSKLIDAYGTNDVVATSFLTHIGPEGLLELNGSVVLAGGEETREVRGELQTGLGALLAAGTRGVQPETRHRGPDPGAADHVSAEWITQLTQAGREEFTIPPQPEHGGQHGGGSGTSFDVYGYQLLGPLLGEGEHSSHFLNRVGTDMLWFEQSYAEEHNGRLPWDDITRPDPTGAGTREGCPNRRGPGWTSPRAGTTTTLRAWTRWVA